jgi:hypothetical protein
VSSVVELEEQCFTRSDSKFFKRPENAFPDFAAEVARSAARFKRLLGRRFLEAFLAPKRLYRSNV